MNEQNEMLIDQYLAGEMNQNELARFEKRLDQEPDLAEALALRREMNDFLHQREAVQDLRSKLEQLDKNYPPEAKTRTLWPRRLWITGIAAAVVLILILLLPQLAPKPSLYEEFAAYQELSLLVRDNSKSYDPAKIQGDFNSGNFADAYEGLIDYLQFHPDDTRAILAVAYAEVALGRIEDAESILTPIFEGTSDYRNTAAWYLALAALKKNDHAAAKSYLETINDGYWSRSARQLLEQL